MKRALGLLLACAVFFAMAGCGGGASVPLITSVTPATADSGPPQGGAGAAMSQAFLTGLAKGAAYPEGKRITAVMLNNVPSSRPQNGISAAQILVEIAVEYGVTRFMALYDDYAAMPKTGGLRSARDQFFQLLLPFWGFYVREGPSAPYGPVNVMMEEYGYGEFDLQGVYAPLYTRDNARATKTYGWYDVSGDSIRQHIEGRELDDYRSYGSPIFNFVPYSEAPRTPAAGPMPELTVVHSAGYRTYFAYNAPAGRYQMSMFNSDVGGVQPATDNNNGERLAFENVLVLFAPVGVYPDTQEDLPRFDYAHGGYGYYFSRGHYEPLIWRKGAPNEALQLYTTDGAETPVLINTGKTYLAVVNDERLPEFDRVMKTGTASQAAGAGEVDPGQAQPAD